MATIRPRAPSAPNQPGPAAFSRQPGPRARNVYLAVGLAVAIVIAVGFGPTVNDGLFNPPSPRPWMLYLHAAMFTAWVVLFIAQAALVRGHRVAWHRRLGVAGFILGALMPVVGIWTALVSKDPITQLVITSHPGHYTRDNEIPRHGHVVGQISQTPLKSARMEALLL